MVTFNCEVCNATVPKKQTEKHYYRCPNAYYTCIDCNTTFDDGYSYQQHTVCITEDEKYQGKLFKGKNKKNGDANQNKQPVTKTKEEPRKTKEESGKTKEESSKKSKSKEESSKKSKSKEESSKKSKSKDEISKDNELNKLLTKGDSLYKIIKTLDDNKNLKKKLLKSLIVDTNGELKLTI